MTLDLADKTAARPASRTKLSKERIAWAAIEIAREDGIDSLSMRKVAARLKAGTMSIYYYVKNRDALLIAMLDHIALGLRHPAPERNPEDEIVNIFLVLYDVFLDEPWLVETLSKTNLASIHVLPLVERIYAALEQLTSNDTEIAELCSVMMEYTFGRAITWGSASATTEFHEDAPFGEVEGAFQKYPGWFRVERGFQEVPGSYERGLRRILRSDASGLV